MAPPYRYTAPAGGGGSTPDLGWARFEFLGSDIVTEEDPVSQKATLTESASYTEWTSAAAITISTGADEDHRNHGNVFIRPLKDANGLALNWSEPWTVHFVIETVSTLADVKNNKMYYGLGFTDSATAIEDSITMGNTVTWNQSGSPFGRSYAFRNDTQENWLGTFTESHVTSCIATHHPKLASQNQNHYLLGYHYDPDDPVNDGSANANTYNAGSSTRIQGTGAVHMYGTVGVIQTITSAKSAQFRIWYKVNSSGGDSWDVGA